MSTSYLMGFIANSSRLVPGQGSIRIQGSEATVPAKLVAWKTRARMHVLATFFGLSVVDFSSCRERSPDQVPLRNKQELILLDSEGIA